MYVNDEGTGQSFYKRSDYHSDYPRDGQVTEWWTLNLKKGDELYLYNYKSNTLEVETETPMYFMGYFVN